MSAITPGTVQTLAAARGPSVGRRGALRVVLVSLQFRKLPVIFPTLKCRIICGDVDAARCATAASGGSRHLPGQNMLSGKRILNMCRYGPRRECDRPNRSHHRPRVYVL